MTTPAFQQLITSEAELRALVGAPSDLAVKKQLDHLDAHARSFIARSPFLLLATSDAQGRCDVSPKGDPAGFVHVLDDKRLAIPDRPGNKRFDGLRNILQNPHVGMIFLLPGKDETLRINGRAWITRDEDLLARMEIGGKRPVAAIGVEVEELFFHCAKAFRRSLLWKPEQWGDISDMPGPARVFFDMAKPTDVTVEQLAERLEDGYRNKLY
jgi:PPOX class probable FMN-dependent enzyme